MLDKLSEAGERIMESLQLLWTELWQAFLLIQTHVYDQLGEFGVYATYVVFGAVALTLLFRLLKYFVSALIFLIIPAVALAWLGSILFAAPFTNLIPYTAAACSLIFFFKS